MYDFLDGNSSPFNVQASAFLLSVSQTKSWVAINQFIQYNKLLCHYKIMVSIDQLDYSFIRTCLRYLTTLSKTSHSSNKQVNAILQNYLKLLRRPLKVFVSTYKSSPFKSLKYQLPTQNILLIQNRLSYHGLI